MIVTFVSVYAPLDAVVGGGFCAVDLEISSNSIFVMRCIIVDCLL